MRKTYTETLGGKTYTTKTLPATEGILLMPRVLALLGDKVAHLLLVTDDSQQEQLLADPKILGGILVNVAERAAETGGILVLKDSLKHTECDQVKVGEAELKANVHERFDEHFAGDYKHLFEVFWWVIRKNFIDP